MWAHSAIFSKLHWIVPCLQWQLEAVCSYLLLALACHHRRLCVSKTWPEIVHMPISLVNNNIMDTNSSIKASGDDIIEYGSTLYVGLQLKQNGRPYKTMVRTVSKSWKEAFLKLQKVSSLHYHEFL